MNTRRLKQILREIQNYHSIQVVSPNETDPSRLHVIPHDDDLHDAMNGMDPQCAVITLCKEAERVIDFIALQYARVRLLNEEKKA